MSELPVSPEDAVVDAYRRRVAELEEAIRDALAMLNDGLPDVAWSMLDNVLKGRR